MAVKIPLSSSRLLISLMLMALGLAACSRKPDVKTELNRLEHAFPSVDTNNLMSAALAAIRKEDYASGVITLENAKRVPGMSAEQLMSVQKTMEAITADLVNRAARGDARAQADLAAIERSRSQ